MPYILQTQQALLVFLAVALVNFFVGSALGPQSPESKARGYLGYRSILISMSYLMQSSSILKIIFTSLVDLFKENFDSGYVVNGGIMQDFFSVFAVYFPAGIGILAGANVSGDLRVRSS